MTRAKLVVVGNGMAGVRAVEEVLARGGDRKLEITMFGEGPYGHYSRKKLSEVLAGRQQESEIFINPLAGYPESSVAMHLGSPVTEVDRASKVVFARNGTRARYDILLIATGSRSITPPLAGAYGCEGGLKSGVFAFRTLEDCRAIQRCARSDRTAAVIGEGSTALEVAWGLANRGSSVHLVHPSAYLLGTKLDRRASEVLYARVMSRGAIVHLGSAVADIVGDDCVEGVVLENGISLACDMIVLAVGSRPNVEIAVRAGLAVELAIIVDSHMRSVDDHSIFAVGECAQQLGRVLGSVSPLWEQTQVFADYVTGSDPVGGIPIEGQPVNPTYVTCFQPRSIGPGPEAIANIRYECVPTWGQARR
ncbi:MAG TPA: FAD-dependent oxidoreductase [Steroidobacteraceae bacterium]|nr:FAD-dependent oxidoreductase [Steroidobacteraceae bacterium]